MAQLEYARNVYPDPSHERGLYPMPATPSTGIATGTVALDTTLFHSGLQSIKLTNNYANTIHNTNLLPTTCWWGLSKWQSYGTAAACTIEAGDVYNGRTAVRVRMTDGTTAVNNVGIRTLWSTTATPNSPSLQAGHTYWVSADCYIGSTLVLATPSVRLVARDDPNNDSLAATFDPSTPFTITGRPVGQWFRATWKITVNASRTVTGLYFCPGVPASTAQPVGAFFQIDNVMVSEAVGNTPAPAYFDGDTAADTGYVYRWSGTQHQSPSVQLTKQNRSVYIQAALGNCDDLGLPGGATVTCAVWVYMPSAATPYTSILRIAGTGVQAVNIPGDGLPRDQWVQVVARTTVLDSTGSLTFRVWTGSMGGDSINIDDFSVAAGDQVCDFNGDTPAQGVYVYGWLGTARHSPSIQYVIVPDPAPLPSVWNPTFSTWQGQDGSVWDLTSESNGVFLTRGGLIGLGGLQSDSYDTIAPGRAGQRHRGSRPQPRTVEWPIYVYNDDSSAGWRALVNKFWRSFHRDRTGTWAVTLDGGEKRYLDLRLSPDFADAGYDLDPLKFGWAAYTIELIADSPFWRGDPITVGWTGSRGSDQFFDPAGSPPFHIISNNTSGTTTIDNPGDEDVWPILSLQGPAATPQIQINGGTITPPTVNSGNTLTIDTSPLNPSAILDDGTDVFSQVSVWDPRPVPYSSKDVPIFVTFDGVGSIAVTVTPLYERVY